MTNTNNDTNAVEVPSDSAQSPCSTKCDLMEEALGIAARCWCDPETEGKTMDTELAEAMAKRIVERLRLLESAWGIIANAYGGNWDDAQNKDWKPAAERWRDEYMSIITFLSRT